MFIYVLALQAPSLRMCQSIVDDDDDPIRFEIRAFRALSSSHQYGHNIVVVVHLDWKNITGYVVTFSLLGRKQRFPLSCIYMCKIRYTFYYSHPYVLNKCTTIAVPCNDDYRCYDQFKLKVNSATSPTTQRDVSSTMCGKESRQAIRVN